jgi:3-oxoacyl-[acyl-carrier protein] reductase
MTVDPLTDAPGRATTQPWSGRTVLITGGTSGTGLRAAERFLAGGANVVVNGRSAERGETAVQHLRGISSRVMLSLADCSVYGEIEKTVADTVSHFGGLDIAVSAGAEGRGDPKPFAEMTPEEISSGLTTRFLARMYPVRAVIPHLLGRPGSNIVMLTTDAARHATSGEAIVGAYAAAVVQATKTIARELSRDHVRVNTVSMTLTAGTRSWDRIFEKESFQSDLFQKAISRFPFGQPPTADDVADAVAFLASPQASSITGQTVSVNGGLSFGGW